MQYAIEIILFVCKVLKLAKCGMWNVEYFIKKQVHTRLVEKSVLWTKEISFDFKRKYELKMHRIWMNFESKTLN